MSAAYFQHNLLFYVLDVEKKKEQQPVPRYALLIMLYKICFLYHFDNYFFTLLHTYEPTGTVCPTLGTPSPLPQ